MTVYQSFWTHFDTRRHKTGYFIDALMEFKHKVLLHYFTPMQVQTAQNYRLRLWFECLQHCFGKFCSVSWPPHVRKTHPNVQHQTPCSFACQIQTHSKYSRIKEWVVFCFSYIFHNFPAIQFWSSHKFNMLWSDSHMIESVDKAVDSRIFPLLEEHTW